MAKRELKILFSDYFCVNKTKLAKYGAYNISLLTDLPLFIDPFRLFNSKKQKYQKLHDEIIKYLRFLKEKSVKQAINEGLLAEWYRFKEVKQNWLGFSIDGNRGRGLGRDFAEALNKNLYSVFKNFGEEKITKGSHLERLCLIKDGVGKDNISDFTVNLIKNYLLSYTQEFSKKYLDKKYCRKFTIGKVRFNYNTESWERSVFYLPYYNGDFVLLTPRDILTKDDTWINKTDLLDQYYYLIPTAILNESLRSQINNYFLSVLPKEPTKKEEREAINKTIQEFPVIIDYFIKSKEERGNEAERLSFQKVEYTETLYLEQFKSLAFLLAEKTKFYELDGDTYREARERVLYLKDVIENKGGHKIFYINGEPIRDEDDLHILYRLTWFRTKSDVSHEVNDGRGPADFKVSKGASDKTIVEMKLARNTHLKKNLTKQIEIYKKASDADKGVYVIIYFTEKEMKRVETILSELNLQDNEHIVLIDASKDNKPSASTA